MVNNAVFDIFKAFQVSTKSTKKSQTVPSHRMASFMNNICLNNDLSEF